MRRLALVLTLLACDSGPAGEGPNESWAYAVARPDCAPWDGAATAVYLTDSPADSALSTPTPFLRLGVYHHIGGVRGRRWSLGEDGPDGAVAVFCGAEAACVSATSGWIEFTPGGTGPLSGQYDVTFPDGRRRAGHFSAPVQEIAALCG